MFFFKSFVSGIDYLCTEDFYWWKLNLAVTRIRAGCQRASTRCRFLCRHSAVWAYTKRCCSFLSSCISIQGYVYVIRSNFGVFHIFLYCDWNLVSGSQRKKKQRELVASGGGCGLGTCLFHATKHVKGP